MKNKKIERLRVKINKKMLSVNMFMFKCDKKSVIIITKIELIWRKLLWQQLSEVQHVTFREKAR